MSDLVGTGRRRRTKFRRRTRVRRTLFALGMLGVVYLAAWLALSLRSSLLARSESHDARWAEGSLSQNLAFLAAQSVSPPLALRNRVVYPYSLIPGGVQTPEDLRRVSEHDRVVGNHFVGFDFRHARIVELDQPKLVYLSYRVGDRVYWTGKRISLRKGERLITDGKTTARTRCANQVSESPQPEVLPAEPPAAKFEEPFFGTPAQIPFPGDFNALGSGRDFAGLGPAGPPGLQSSNVAPFPGGGLPPVFPPPVPSNSCSTGKENGAGSGNKPCPQHKPPPPPVPEPATVLLVSSGLAGIYWRRRAAARKSLAPK